MSEYVWQRGVESRDGHAVVWYAHIRMKLHRKICIVYAYIRICRKTEYMRRNCICAEKLHMLIWKVNSSVPPDQINDFENVNCTNCGCSSIWSNDLIPHNQPHSECKPLSLSIPLIEFLETTKAHWFLSLDQRGKVAFRSSLQLYESSQFVQLTF